MKTYQDFEKAQQSGGVEKFIEDAVTDHKSSEKYQIARDANAYYAKRNITILKLQKFLYNMQGERVPDLFSANNKIPTLFYRRFIIQQVRYLLANGIIFTKEQTMPKLGKKFDAAIAQLATCACNDSVAFGFWNLDHLEVFPFCDTPTQAGFVPLWDEETGALRGGIRYWMLENTKTTRYTLYIVEGVTEYIKKDKEKIKQLAERTAYKSTSRKSTATGVMETVGESYSVIPIFPMYVNDLHESEIVGIRAAIDCYDYVKSGLANDIDDATNFYWLIKNAGGMDDVDLAQFLERLRTVKAGVLDADNGVDAEPHTLEIPCESRVKMLEILKRDLYEDFQIVNVSELAAAQKTATEIRAAYQPMNDKMAAFRDGVSDFIVTLLEFIGIDDTPSYRPNQITNQLEETQMVMTAAEILGDELILKKLPFLTPEEVEKRLKELAAEDVSRFEGGDDIGDDEDGKDVNKE